MVARSGARPLLLKSFVEATMQNGISDYIFGGHGTFVLRGNWLKRLVDECLNDSAIFSRPDALVRFGVGKNMVDAIRYWGVATGIITSSKYKAVEVTEIGKILLSDDGIDPYLVTNWSKWWLHWQLVDSAAYTWRHVFRVYAGIELDRDKLVRDIQTAVGAEGRKTPSEDTVRRDIACLVNSYSPTSQHHNEAEEQLTCPLVGLKLLRNVGGQTQFVSAERADVPDSIFLSCVAKALVASNRTSLPFSELMWGLHGPGRIFRFTEDALLHRISEIEKLTNGAAMFSDHAGVRSVMWQDVDRFDWQDYIVLSARKESDR